MEKKILLSQNQNTEKRLNKKKLLWWFEKCQRGSERDGKQNIIKRMEESK